MNKRYSIEDKDQIITLGRTYKLAETIMFALAKDTCDKFPNTKAAGCARTAFNKFEISKEEVEMAAWKYCDFFIEEDVFNNSYELRSNLSKLLNCRSQEEQQVALKNIKGIFENYKKEINEEKEKT